MVLMSGNAPESYANLAIKLFIKQPAVFQLHEELVATLGPSPRTIVSKTIIILISLRGYKLVVMSRVSLESQPSQGCVI